MKKNKITFQLFSAKIQFTSECKYQESSMKLQCYKNWDRIQESGRRPVRAEPRTQHKENTSIFFF